MAETLDTFTLLEEYLDYLLTIRGRSELTVKEYRYDLMNFFRYWRLFRAKDTSLPEEGFEAIDISGMDREHLQKVTLQDLYAYLSWLAREKKVGNSARARKVSSLRGFFNYFSQKRSILEHNPAAELETPKLLKKQPRYLSLEESKRLLAEPLREEGPLAVRNHAIITLFLNCGLRLSELVGLNQQSIRGNTLIVMGKGGKERTIYLNKACLDAIEAYEKVRPTRDVKDPEAFFISRQGNRLAKSSVQRMIHQYLLKAGLDPNRYSTHKLRHTAATLMYQYGQVDIRLLQQILGHESVATTEIYTHLDDDQLHQAVEKNPLAQEPAPDVSSET